MSLLMSPHSPYLSFTLYWQVDLSRLRVISVPDDSGSLLVSKVDAELMKAQRKVVVTVTFQHSEILDN